MPGINCMRMCNLLYFPVITITSLVIDIAITIVGEMSDSSFEDSVVYALTTSHLTLKCSCGYPPVMRRVSSSSYKVCLLSSTISLSLGLIGSVYGHG